MPYLQVNSSQHKEILEKIGHLLRVLRTEKKISQKQLAFELDVSLTHYQNMEYGKVNFGIMTLFRLAEVLEVNPSIFINFEQQDK